MRFTDDGDPGAASRALADALAELEGLAGGFAGEMEAAVRVIREMDGETRRLSQSLGSSLRRAFDRAIFGGAKLGDVLRGLVSDIGARTLDAALRPATAALGGGISSLVGSLVGGLFAEGAAFSAGRVRAFARGGVVDGPTVFPMRGGLGLMGEAGPEAIMPLVRGPDGRLGVVARGAGSGPVTVNITTPDIEGFRRSRSQIAAELARVVSRGAGRL